MIDTRDSILSELEVSRRLVCSGQAVVTRMLVFAPDGFHHVILELPEDDEPGREEQLQAVKSFMIWKAAYAFTLADELKDPDAISAVAVTRTDVTGAIQRVWRTSLTFDDPVWFGREEIGEEFLELLPPREVAVTAEQLEFMRLAFEEGGVPGITWEKVERE